MTRADRPWVGWALDMLWRASNAPLPPVLNPPQMFNSEPLNGLAFRVRWGMDTAEYIERMRMVGNIEVAKTNETLRRVTFVAVQGSVWYPPKLVFDIGHNGQRAESCNVSAIPQGDIDDAQPPQPNPIGAVSAAYLDIEASGNPIQELARYAEVERVRLLALSAGVSLLQAAALPKV